MRTMLQPGAPYVVIFDEIDKVIRNSFYSSTKPNVTLADLYSYLDGVMPETGRIIIMTGNENILPSYPILDRPGRVDRSVHCALPDDYQLRRTIQFWKPEWVLDTVESLSTEKTIATVVDELAIAEDEDGFLDTLLKPPVVVVDPSNTREDDLLVEPTRTISEVLADVDYHIAVSQKAFYRYLRSVVLNGSLNDIEIIQGRSGLFHSCIRCGTNCYTVDLANDLSCIACSLKDVTLTLKDEYHKESFNTPEARVERERLMEKYRYLEQMVEDCDARVREFGDRKPKPIEDYDTE